MNYIILFATFVIVKSSGKCQQLRLLLSSIIGSVYAVIVYLDILQIYSNIFAKIILSIIMTYIAFNPKNIKQLLKHLLIFYLVSFIFGGCTFALIYFIKPENVQMKNGVFVGIYPIKVAILAGVVAFIVTQIAFKINKNKLNSQKTFFNIEIFFESKMLKVKALLDSGNMLKDPISKFPVIIVEKDELKKIISEDFLKYIENVMGGGKEEIYENLELKKHLSRVRMVPFMSIGKENGMLIGIRVDNIKIETEDLEIENVIVAIYDKKLTKDNKYNALIGLNLLEGEEKNEIVTSFKK